MVVEAAKDMLADIQYDRELKTTVAELKAQPIVAP